MKHHERRLHHQDFPTIVNLSEDRQVLKAAGRLASPVTWTGGATWGRKLFQQSLVYTAHRYSVDPRGVGQVRLRENAGYRWGYPAGAPGRKSRHSVRRALRASPAVAGSAGRSIAPMLRRPDRESRATPSPPRSEQQRPFSAKTAPSLYDLRNLFQVNVEEGPPSLGDGLSCLQKIFRARDGREGGR